MPKSKTCLALLGCAAILAGAAVASTASAAPRASESEAQSASTEFPAPTSAENAASALMRWLADHPSPNEGGVEILRPGYKDIVVYWKGQPPDGLKSLAASQSVPVTFRAAEYSIHELEAAAKALVDNNKGVVTSAATSGDYTGVNVTLSSKAPSNARAGLRNASAVPILSSSIEDPVPLSRNSDGNVFSGGALLRLQGVSGSACSGGVALHAGTNYYMSVAWHCGMYGTIVGYDAPSYTLGTIRTDLGHQIPERDIALVKAVYWTEGRIWTGNAYTTDFRPVYAAVRPAVGMRVVCSCGVSGNSTVAIYRIPGASYWTVDGVTVGPGFYGQANDLATRGSMQRGDSGSPVIRSTSSGKFEVNGFISQSLGPTANSCEPGRHAGFDGPCYAGFKAVFADAAIGAFIGLHLTTG